MKMNFLEEVRTLFSQSQTWFKLEVEYLKLTVAEKVTLLLGTLIIGFIALLLSMVVLIMLALSLAEVFKLIMHPGLAYLSTAGAVCVLLLSFYLLRRPILMNPIARLITKIFFDKKH